MMMSWQPFERNDLSNFKRSCSNKPHNNLKLKSKPNSKRLKLRILMPFFAVIFLLMHEHD